ncbi:hypothetical protein L2E81_08865 [Planktothrix agardhii 1033]|nr:hypothetical protein [Planktothrix agardhii 1033]
MSKIKEEVPRIRGTRVEIFATASQCEELVAIVDPETKCHKRPPPPAVFHILERIGC